MTIPSAGRILLRLSLCRDHGALRTEPVPRVAETAAVVGHIGAPLGLFTPPLRGRYLVRMLLGPSVEFGMRVVELDAPDLTADEPGQEAEQPNVDVEPDHEGAPVEVRQVRVGTHVVVGTPQKDEQARDRRHEEKNEGAVVSLADGAADEGAVVRGVRTASERGQKPGGMARAAGGGCPSSAAQYCRASAAPPTVREGPTRMR
eukprot:scaffold250_cov110-Isochrysis_galbana.AAC.9